MYFRSLRKIVVVIILISGCLAGNGGTSSYASSGKNNSASAGGLDAMFVLDVSYSMNQTDKDRIADEVIRMFMDMSGGQKTRLGFVAYNDRITSSVPLTDITSSGARQQLRSKIDSLKRTGYTDLGLGLRRGAELLAKSRANGRQPFLILLSDGETDIGNNSGRRTFADSANDVDKVINMARKSGYPIYTVGLNNGGKVNSSELERISSETGGTSFITGSADDLPEIFNQIFASQIQSVLTSVAAVTANGSLQEITVEIPNSSMADANIIMLSEHPVTEAQLYYKSSNVSFIQSDKYSLMKIVKPVKGNFVLKFRGHAGDLVKINLLGNYNMRAEAAISGGQKVLKGQATVFEAALYGINDRSKVQDTDIYNRLKAELIVTPKEGKVERIPLTNTGSGFKGTYIFPKSNTYQYHIRVDGSDFYREGKTAVIEINNLPPVALNKSIDLSKDDGAVKLDLTSYFEDPNKDSLTYTVDTEQGDRSLAQADIKDGQLLLSSLHSGKSYLSVTATDDEGAKVTARIPVHITSMVEKMLRIGVLSVLLLIAVGLLYWFVLRPKPVFRGRLEGYFLSTASGTDIPVTHWPMTSFQQRRMNLAELLNMMEIREHVPEAGNIWFKAGKNETLIVRHDSRCTVVHGRTPVERGKQEVLEYNDRLYITFEDGLTEIEIRYKAIKPKTNIYVGQQRDSEVI